MRKLSGSQSSVDDDTWQWILGGVVGAWGAVMSWIGVKQVNRIDALEEGKAGSKSTDARFAELLARIDSHQEEDRMIHREIAAKLDTVVERIGATNTHLAGIVGELRGKGHIA